MIVKIIMFALFLPVLIIVSVQLWAVAITIIKEVIEEMKER